ncbi:MAG: tetratricopeptide repeat protein [Alphaproteobacteria bacterium]|nr:tetratricopeptide repeat protein [Alphaproteobacteria bacterium]
MSAFKAAVIISLICAAAPAFAGYAEGEQAMNAKQYTQAFAEFKPLARSDFRAQYYLGFLYLNGYGAPKDLNTAFSYVKKSADAGFDMAQALLGYMHAEGLGTSKNKAKAIDLYEKAAEQGNISANLNLGVAYYTGDGVAKDIKRAIAYFENVPATDRSIVARYLGTIYLYEPDFVNYDKAYQNFMAGARGEDLDSYYTLGYMLQKGFGATADMGKALQYYRYAASKNHAPAQYALGMIYANGDGVIANKIDAYAWLSMAAAQGYAAAKTALAKLEDTMSISDVDRGRRQISNYQQTMLGSVASPLAESKAAMPAATPRTNVIIRRFRTRQ